MKKILAIICTACLVASLLVCLTACNYEVDIDQLLAKCDTHFEYDSEGRASYVFVNTTDYSVYVHSIDSNVITLDYIEDANYNINREVEDFGGMRYRFTVERVNKVVKPAKNKFVIIGMPIRPLDVLFVTTVSGNVQSEVARAAALSLETTSGNILLKDSNYELKSITSADLRTVSGNIDGKLQAYYTFVESTSGNITLNLNSNEIGIKSVSGKIRCAIEGFKYDFNIEVETDGGKSNVANQTISGSRKYLWLITTSGSINIEFDED